MTKTKTEKLKLNDIEAKLKKSEKVHTISMKTENIKLKE